MNTYEELLTDISADLSVVEKTFKSKAKGLCKGNKIGISKCLDASSEKACILAEELGHYYLTVGDILDQSKIENRKQEKKARNWAYERLVTISGLVHALEKGSQNFYEISEELEVTEEFLIDAVEHYKEKYGQVYTADDYILYLEPLGVLKKIDCGEDKQWLNFFDP